MLLLAGTPLVISLSQALARADASPAAVVARAEAAASRAKVSAASAPAAPVVTVGTSRYAARESVAVSEEIRWFGQRRAEKAAAEAEALSAEARALVALREARRLVRRAWVDLAAAEDAARLAEESAHRAEDVSSMIAARVDAGRAPRLDLVRSRAETAVLRAKAAGAAEERRGAFSHLSSLLAMDDAREGTTDGVRPPPLDAVALDAAIERATPESSPSYAAAAAALKAAIASRDAAKKRLLPGLSVAAGVNADDPGNPGPDYQGSLSVTLPIGARAKPALRVAEAELSVKTAELDLARREWRASLDEALSKVRAARARLAALDTDGVPAADESARLTREAYEAGRGDVFRVVDAEKALLEARSERLAAYKELEEGEADLLAQMGEVEENDAKKK